MSKFCLGIIGRCLAFQPWIEIQDLYHRQLKEMLQKKDNIILRVSLAGRSDMEPYERMKILYKKKHLDGVLYHFRTFDDLPQRLVYSRKNNFGKFTYSFHPFLFKRFFVKEKYYDGCDAFPVMVRMRKKGCDETNIPLKMENDASVTYRKFLKIPLNKLNLLAGKLCGLNKRKIDLEWSYFEKLRKFCFKLNIPLFVLGPILSVERLQIKSKLLFFFNIQRFIGKKLSKHQIPYYFFDSLYDEEKNHLHKRDQQHLTKEGHTFLAKELYPIMSTWIKSILENQRDKFI